MSAADDARPEPDRVTGAPHPRETVALHGHEDAQRALLSAAASRQMPHAWLISGPRGVGKATFAWAIARHLTASPPRGDATLAMDPDDPVFRRAAALAEPRIGLVRRGWDERGKRLKTQLTVDEIRNLKGYFALSSPDAGWRVAIIDSADEMNDAAANALLKLLEEPPSKVVLLLVCHQPMRLLPTIRSRCRALRLGPLSPEAFAAALTAAGQEVADAPALHRLTGGSPGDAIRLIQGGGLEIHRAIVDILATAPHLDRGRILALTSGMQGRDSADRYALTTELITAALARLARAAAQDGAELSPSEAKALDRLGRGPAAARMLAETVQRIDERAQHARAVNLDPEQVILDMFLAIGRAAEAAA